MDRRAMESGNFDIPLGGPIVGPIVVDPGSAAFDHPEKYGYKLLYKDLEQYVEGLSEPSWHRWLNYETEALDNKALVDLVLSTVDFSTDQREKWGLYSRYQAVAERLKTAADRHIVKEVETILAGGDELQRESALKDLKRKHEAFLNSPIDRYL